MLINSDRLLNCPVLSLHVGGMIAKTTEIVVDPNDLKVMAFRLEGPDIGKGAGEYLQENRIREYSSMGMVIEDYELTYNGTTITALFDKNNRIVYLEHFVSAPEATGNGTFSMVPFDINLTCNYIAKYDISY